MEVFTRTSPYTGPVRAVVLDWAGTAVDYGCMGPVAVFMEVFKRHGVSVTTVEARGPMGLRKKDHVRSMCQMESVAARWQTVHGRRPDEHDVEAMYADVEPLLISSVARYADPIPGLLDTVKRLRAEGIRIGSSTGYTSPMMAVLVEEASRRGYTPDSVVSSSDVPAGRPYPWMCYVNAINLGIYPLEAWVKIGDTLTDIHEGLNAGMWTIGVTKTGNELGLTEAEAARLTPSDLRKRLDVIEKRLYEDGAHYVTESIEGCPAIIQGISARLARGERP